MKYYLLAFAFASAQLFAATFAPNTKYQACFTPQDNCTRLIAQAIYKAKRSIDVQAYSFTAYRIAHALAYMSEHHIKVRIILDKSNFFKGQYSKARYLIKHHVPVWVDYLPRIAHNKVIIIDGQCIETGSFNYTNSAQWHNTENVLIIYSANLAKQYTTNFNIRLRHAKRILHFHTIPRPAKEA